MTWFKVDDGFWSHPKTMTLSNDAVALWVRAGAYCCQHLTDGHVPKGSLRMLGDAEAAAELVAAGLWDDAERGYQFHDWDAYQPSRDAVLADRASNAARQAVARNPDLRDAVRERDNNRCRYCGRVVEWNNRRGGAGGTYDHVIPTGGSTFDNLVVCCRGCNSRKGRRTPEQAGMSLIQIRPRSDSNQTNKPDSVRADDVRVPRPDPTRPDPTTSTSSGYLKGEGGDANRARNEPPPSRCPKHINDEVAPACGRCKEFRLARERWDAQHANDGARSLADARAAKQELIDGCPRCDEAEWILVENEHGEMEPSNRKCSHGRRSA